MRQWWMILLGLIILATGQYSRADQVWTGAQILDAMEASERSLVLDDLSSQGITEEQVRRSELTVHDPMDQSIDQPMIELTSVPAVEVRDPQNSLSERNQYFIGIRLGFPLIVGFNASYLRLDENSKPVFHVDAETATVLFISSINIGAFYHPWSSPFYIGGRIHQVIFSTIFDSYSVYHMFGIGPEVGWLKTLGESNWGYFRIGLEGVAFHDMTGELNFVPNLKLGFAVKIFGH